jgi:peroxiredoxin
MLGALLIAGGVIGEAAGADGLVGKPAPAFTLPDSTGQPRSLGDWKGRVLVLEWFNNECPFVNKHYTSGNMQRLQAEHTERGVIWLTIASSAPGKQGALTPSLAQAVIRQRGARQTALLFDHDGAVGRLYGAKTTPHMFIVGLDGAVVYTGAIDDRPSTDPADVTGATNYVQRALDELDQDRAVSIPETKPYGCSVKY